MLTNASVFVAVAILYGFSTFLGLIPVHRMIQRREAQHELRWGSASYFRRMGGLFLVFLWIITITFLSTVIGDWGATGDLDAALARAGRRIGLLIRFAASLGGVR